MISLSGRLCTHWLRQTLARSRPKPAFQPSDGRGYRRHILARCGLGASDRLQLLTDAGAEVEGADERLNEAKDLGESTGRGRNSR